MQTIKDKLNINHGLTHEAILQIKDAIKENDRSPKKKIKPLLEELQYRNELNDKLFHELLDLTGNKMQILQYKIDLILQTHDDIKNGKKYLEELFETMDRVKIGITKVDTTKINIA